MKKILGCSLLTAACVLLSGCATAHADDNKPREGYVNENITVRSGYYTCEEDNSYIHVDGNMIETCNFDYTGWVEREWARTMAELDEEERERQAPNFDMVLENSTELAKEYDALQEFVVYTFPLSTYYPEKSDTTKLVLYYENAKNSGVFNGYDYLEDGTILSRDFIYSYAGEELPEKVD